MAQQSPFQHSTQRLHDQLALVCPGGWGDRVSPATPTNPKWLKLDRAGGPTQAPYGLLPCWPTVEVLREISRLKGPFKTSLLRTGLEAVGLFPSIQQHGSTICGRPLSFQLQGLPPARHRQCSPLQGAKWLEEGHRYLLPVGGFKCVCYLLYCITNDVPVFICLFCLLSQFRSWL